MMEYNSRKVQAVQHCWVVKKGNPESLVIEGVVDTSVYQ